MRSSSSSRVRCAGLVFIAFSAWVTVRPQVPAPTQTPDNDIVKISTSLIRLDVTVTDSKGKAVSDLRRDEIEVFENGIRQKVTDLRFVAAAPRPGAKSEAEKAGVPAPPSQLRPEQVRRTFALVVDDLTLSFESVSQTRRALKKFVDDQMEEGDLVAIIRTGAGVGALQQFTSDKRLLYAAIERVKWNPLGNGGISEFAPLRSVVPIDEDQPEPEAGDRTDAGIEREFEDFRKNYFAAGSLGALDYVVRGMSELPGRKSIVLFSDGFELTNIDAQGFSDNSPLVDPLRRLIEQANRASVVVYAMDPRGLVYTGLTAADNASGRNARQLESEMANRRQLLSETQQSLRYLSSETGGFALINNNDLSGGVKRVLEDQSYYLVSYEPESETFDPAKLRFNRIEVKVLRSGANVRYRSGFFNVADREPSAQPASKPTGQLEDALVSPFALNGINVRLNALFGNDPKNVSYVRSLLHISAADMRFTDADKGQKKAVFEVLAMSFGDTGTVVDQLKRSYTLTVTPEAYKKISAEGFIYHFVFPVKKPGPYQYRVAVRDTQSGRVGSASQFIEVPDLKKNRLTLSSIVLENLSESAWKIATGSATASYESNPMTDTALRRIKAGTILRLGFEIYNARLDKADQPRLTAQLRVFSEGKLVLDGKPGAVERLGQTDLGHIRVARALSLGNKITPGDYILQVIVRDAAEPKKERVSSQFIQFEIVP